jgi:hypothetical protein
MQNLADITGAGATVQISNPNITARWVQFLVSGAGTVRIGGANVTANLGLPVAAGAGMFLPVQTADGQSTSPYSLAGLYAYIPVGATLSVGYEQFG